ncbi:MAG TPA: glycosyltransferase family 4 protein [Stenomitos sp.]
MTHNVIPNDGQGRLNYEIIREASQHGHQVTVVSSQLAPQLQHNSQVNWISIPVKGLPTQLVREVVFSRRSAHWLHQHRQEFDLVITNGAVTGAAADVNIVSFVHRAWLASPFHVSRVRRDIYGFYQWLYTGFNAHWEKTAFRQAQVVVGVSQRVKREVVETGIPPKDICVIPCGVNLEEFSPGSANRRLWSLPEDVPLALFAGDIRLNRKNLDTVLQALVDVPDLHLAVAGQTEGSPYPALAAQLGLSQRVHFLGLQPGISELLRAVDVFVFPSRYEPFGLVVLEAMAAGLPVITATTTGAAEIVTPESGIVLSDSEDAQALAQALLRLTRDPVLRYHMGHAARTVAQQYSWTDMAHRYVNLFEEIASREAQRSPIWLKSNIPALEV